MKKLMLVAVVGLTVLGASAFQAKESRAVKQTNPYGYEQADTVPGKKKGDTAKHRYPKKDSTNLTTENR